MTDPSRPVYEMNGYGKEALDIAVDYLELLGANRVAVARPGVELATGERDLAVIRWTRDRSDGFGFVHGAGSFTARFRTANDITIDQHRLPIYRKRPASTLKRSARIRRCLLLNSRSPRRIFDPSDRLPSSTPKSEAVILFCSSRYFNESRPLMSDVSMAWWTSS